jgi:hypothetical protein
VCVHVALAMSHVRTYGGRHAVEDLWMVLAVAAIMMICGHGRDVLDRAAKGSD